MVFSEKLFKILKFFFETSKKTLSKPKKTSSHLLGTKNKLSVVHSHIHSVQNTKKTLFPDKLTKKKKKKKKKKKTAKKKKKKKKTKKKKKQPKTTPQAETAGGLLC